MGDEELTIEPAFIGALSGLCVAGLAVLAFWINWSEKISTAKGTAESAIQVAAEVEKDLKECHDRITTMQSSMALYRESAIEKFVTHAAITEVEKRLVESQAKLEHRLVDALEGLNKRLDRLIEAGLRH